MRFSRKMEIKIETPEIVVIAKTLNKFLSVRNQIQFIIEDVYDTENINNDISNSNDE